MTKENIAMPLSRPLGPNNPSIIYLDVTAYDCGNSVWNILRDDQEAMFGVALPARNGYESWSVRCQVC